MIKSRIVVVEDEPAIRRGVVDTLRIAGFEVIEAADGIAGQVAATQTGVDLVLLDIMLPKKDGLSVLGEIRRQHPNRAVILLTARGTEDDRVRGLKLGADDYVVKPFSARELLARVESILRRVSPKPPEVNRVQLGQAVIDIPRREICFPSGDRLELSETESALLQYLVSNRERAVTREELLERVWGITPDGLETRTVDMHVARLRAKLKNPKCEETGEAIVTVRSRGYMAGPALCVA